MNSRLDDDLGPSMQRRAFKHQLIERMTKQKINAAELSRLAGLSRDAISSYTNLRSLPSEATLQKLAKVLNCKPEALMAPLKNGATDVSTVIEIREYSKPGYKLLVARVPVPEAVVGKLYDKLMAYAKESANGK